MEPERWKQIDRILAAALERVHNVRVKLMPVDVMGAAIRRFDRHRAPHARFFQLFPSLEPCRLSS